MLSQLREVAGMSRGLRDTLLRTCCGIRWLRCFSAMAWIFGWSRSFSDMRRLRRRERYTHISKEHMIGVLRKHHPSLTLGEKTALEPAG